MRRHWVIIWFLIAACGDPDTQALWVLPHPLAVLGAEPGYPKVWRDRGFDETTEGGQEEITIGGRDVRRTWGADGDRRRVLLESVVAIDVGQSALRARTAERLGTTLESEATYERNGAQWRIVGVQLRGPCSAVTVPEAWGSGPEWRNGALRIRRRETNATCTWDFAEAAEDRPHESETTWAHDQFAADLADGRFDDARARLPRALMTTIDPRALDLQIRFSDVDDRAHFVSSLRDAFDREFHVGPYRVFENDRRAVAVKLAADTPVVSLSSPPRANTAFTIVAKNRRVERWP